MKQAYSLYLSIRNNGLLTGTAFLHVIYCAKAARISVLTLTYQIKFRFTFLWLGLHLNGNHALIMKTARQRDNDRRVYEPDSSAR